MDASTSIAFAIINHDALDNLFMEGSSFISPVSNSDQNEIFLYGFVCDKSNILLVKL